MNYGRLVFALAVLGLAACAPQKQSGVNAASVEKSSAAVVAAPVGSFKQEYYNAYNEKNYLTIDGEKVTASTVCKDGGQKILVQVSSPAQVSSSHFNVLTSAKKTEMVGSHECTAELKSGVTAFEIKRNAIYLAADGGDSLFYGYMMGKRPSVKEQFQAMIEDGAQGAIDGATVVKETVVNGAVATKSFLDASDRKFNDAAVASRKLPGAIVQGAINGATAVKEGAINGATAVKEGAINGATATKEFLKASDQKFNDAAVSSRKLPGAIVQGAINGATAVKESAINGATAVKEGAINGATATKEFLDASDRKFNDAAVASRKIPGAIAQGAINGATATKEAYLKGQATSLKYLGDKASAAKETSKAVLHKVVTTLGQGDIQ